MTTAAVTETFFHPKVYVKFFPAIIKLDKTFHDCGKLPWKIEKKLISKVIQKSLVFIASK